MQVANTTVDLDGRSHHRDVTSPTCVQLHTRSRSQSMWQLFQASGVVQRQRQRQHTLGRVKSRRTPTATRTGCRNTRLTPHEPRWKHQPLLARRTRRRHVASDNEAAMLQLCLVNGRTCGRWQPRDGHCVPQAADRARVAYRHLQQRCDFGGRQVQHLAPCLMAKQTCAGLGKQPCPMPPVRRQHLRARGHDTHSRVGTSPLGACRVVVEHGQVALCS